MALTSKQKDALADAAKVAKTGKEIEEWIEGELGYEVSFKANPKKKTIELLWLDTTVNPPKHSALWRSLLIACQKLAVNGGVKTEAIDSSCRFVFTPK